MEKNLINEIKILDQAITQNDKRLKKITSDEENLAHALKSAQKKESEFSRKYVEFPAEKTQDNLESSRDFTLSCQRRVTLFKNGSSAIVQDNKSLWQRRKILLDKLSKIRIHSTREKLKRERQHLLETLYPNVIRLMLLTSHLDGHTLLQLDLNRMMEKHNGKFKHELDKAEQDLKAQFEALRCHK